MARRPPRKNVGAPRHVKLRVFERDGWRCYLCGVGLVRDPAAPAFATVDHLVPVSYGGDDHESNLRACCWACNQERGNGAVRPKRIGAPRVLSPEEQAARAERREQRARQRTTLAEGARIRRPRG